MGLMAEGCVALDNPMQAVARMARHNSQTRRKRRIEGGIFSQGPFHDAGLQAAAAEKLYVRRDYGCGGLAAAVRANFVTAPWQF